MLDLTAAYTKERKQFDVPIATFQAVGHRAADCLHRHRGDPADHAGRRSAAWPKACRRPPRCRSPSSGRRGAASASRWPPRTSTAASASTATTRWHRHYTRAKELELQLGGATEHLVRIGRELAA